MNARALAAAQALKDCLDETDGSVAYKPQARITGFPCDPTKLAREHDYWAPIIAERIQRYQGRFSRAGRERSLARRQARRTLGRMIDALNLESREPFTLCKYGTDQWEVNRVIEEKADPIRKIESAQAGYKSNGQTTNHAPDAPDALQTPAPPPAPPVNGPVNGCGESSADIMGRCYRAAIDVALGAVEYGKERGLMLAPCFGDVRALAATICISETGARK